MFYSYNKESLEFKKISIRKYVIIAILIFLSMGFGGAGIKIVLINGEKEINLVTENSFSEEKLIKEIESYNFKYPDIILAQAYLESGNFKSNVFLENGNLFGMREAGGRVTTALGTKNNHAYYENWRQSLIDRSLFEAAYLRNLSRSEYMLYLKRNYAEIKDYDKLVQNLINKKQLKKKIKNV